MPKSVQEILSLVKRVSGQETSLDLLLEFEKTLDNANLYAYKNWMVGELVEGPDINRYWFITTWMYPMKLMPDPDGALRLLKYGCKVYFKKDIYIEPSEVHSIEDIVDSEQQKKKAKPRKVPVWLVTIKMPRKFVDEAQEGILEFEDEEVDIEDINAAWDENLDDSSSSKEVDVDQEEDSREENFEEPTGPGL